MQVRLGYSKSEIWNLPDYSLPDLLKKFTYTNKSISYQYSQHLKGRFRFIKKLRVTKGMNEEDAIEAYEDELDRLYKAKKVCLLDVNSKGVITFPTGLLKKIGEHLQKKIRQFDFIRSIVDLREAPRKTFGFPVVGEKVTLWPFQIEALSNLLEAGQGTVVSGTGTGKTLIIQEALRELGLRSVVIMPTLSILNQTVKRFESYFGKAKIGVYGGGKKQIRKITLTCAPSLAKSDPELWKDVDVIIADECHHVPCNTVEHIFYNIIPNAFYRFGFTATNYRTDGADLAIEAATFPPVFEYDIKKGIEEGFLAKPTFVMFNVPFTSHKYGGSHPTFTYKNHILKNYEFNSKVKGQIQKLVNAGDRVLVLVREKDHGHYFQSQVPGSIFVRNKESKKDTEDLQYVAPYMDPHKAVRAFNDGLISCLIGTSIIGEGTDIVPVDVLFVLTGGSSKVTVMQNIGRGLRRCPGKDKVTIIDYWFSNHDMLDRHSQARYNYYKQITGEVHVLDFI